jgi:hypothetical protein
MTWAEFVLFFLNYKPGGKKLVLGWRLTVYRMKEIKEWHCFFFVHVEYYFHPKFKNDVHK